MRKILLINYRQMLSTFSNVEAHRAWIVRDPAARSNASTAGRTPRTTKGSTPTNFPEGATPRDEREEERTSDEFDPNRFGKFKLNTNFFKWAISTPLPKEREEDLWHDTIPPGGVEGRPPASLPEGPTAELKATRPGVPPRVLDLTPSEAAVLKKGKLRRTGVFALIFVLIGGLVAFFVAGNDGSEEQATIKAPTVETEVRDVKSADDVDASKEANAIATTKTPAASESRADNSEAPPKPKASGVPPVAAQPQKPSPKLTKPSSVKPAPKTPPSPKADPAPSGIAPIIGGK